ncbi:MAG: hypothetical protein FJW30_19635 [Acidobacteria bacterium]|nr:hypothetical protein [Acidobacteriota bacterium]
MRAALEDWAHGEGLLQRRDPRAKLLAVLIFLIFTGSTAPGGFARLGVLAAGLLLALALPGVPGLDVLRRAAAILPFPLTFGLISYWVSGSPRLAATLVARSYLSAVAVVLLMATTPMAEILRALRALGVPAVMVLVLQALVRYLRVVIDQAMRMRRAALARGGAARTFAQRRWTWRRAGGALAVLFGRSYTRAEHVHQAMLARGFQGETLALFPLRWRTKDSLLVVSSLLLSAAAVVL